MTTGHRQLPVQLGFLAATIAAVIAIAPLSHGQDQTAQAAPAQEPPAQRQESTDGPAENPTASPAQPAASYTPSGAESPAVAQAITGNDPEALAKTLLKERWDNNLATDSNRPLKPLHGKLGVARGKTALVVFHVVNGETAGLPAKVAKEMFRQKRIAKTADEPAEPETPEEAEQKTPLKTAVEVSKRPEVKDGKLAVIVVSPNTKQEVAEAIAKLGGDPKAIIAVENRDDSIRRDMKLYSTPYLLFDPKGQLVWSLRAGQRGPGNTGTADLDEAITRVVSGKYSAKPSSAPMKAGAETPVFTFEDGAPGWIFSGTWREGTSSEADYPGLVKGFEGRRWLSSFPPDGSRTGIAVSPTFKIEKRYLHLKVGGGDLTHQAGVALVCGRTTPQLSSGKNTFEMNAVTWDMAGLQGKDARLVAYDNCTAEMRNGIMLDAVFASDSPTPPASFADHHDPHNQAHAARVAADIPEDYKAFQSGDFHCEVKEGPTYLAEFNGEFAVPKMGTVVIPWVPFLETAAQKIGKQSAEVTFKNKTLEAKMVRSSEDTAFPWMLTVDGKLAGTGQAKYRMSAEITPKTLTFVRGPQPDHKPLTPEEMARIKRTYPQCENPDRIAQIEKEGLQRWKGERDAEYLLRAFRWIQRYWNGAEGWGGWPTSGKYKDSGAQDLEIKAMSCPAVACILDCLHYAGIPSVAGQGMWVQTDGQTELTDHFRALVFLENAGWILIDDAKNDYSGPGGPYTFGRSTGTNFFQTIWDPVYLKTWGTWTVELPGKWTSRLADKVVP